MGPVRAAEHVAGPRAPGSRLEGVACGRAGLISHLSEHRAKKVQGSDLL